MLGGYKTQRSGDGIYQLYDYNPINMFFAKIFLLCTVSCVLATSVLAIGEPVVLGGPVVLQGEALAQAKLLLEKCLATGDDYTVAKVVRATKQVVAGFLYNFIVDLVDKNGFQKECHVTIIEAAAPISTKYDVICPNDPEVSKHLDA